MVPIPYPLSLGVLSESNWLLLTSNWPKSHISMLFFNMHIELDMVANSCLPAFGILMQGD